MKRKNLYVLVAGTGFSILLTCGIALAAVQPVQAQCGSQASSCKNCHEVQGQKPVNSDGTGWHQSHAFGDFCYICHGGNPQATDETTAHQAMVAPLSDVNAACAQCHADDLQAKAQVYAKVLNVSVGTGASSAASAGASGAATATPAAASATVSEPAAPAGNTGNLVDYVQRYNQNALGRNSPNWGNVILLVMIAAMLVGGGGLVLTRERLVRVSFKDTQPVTGEYPGDVVDLVPEIAKLKPGARKALQRMLKKPDAAADLLDAVDKLSQDKKQD